MSKLNIITGKQYFPIDTLITHGGVFHADDVVSTAILEDLAIYESLNLKSISELPGHEEMVNNEIIKISCKMMRATNEDLPSVLGAFPIPVLRFRDIFKEYPAEMIRPNDFIYDTGHGAFDHHQKDAKLHLDGRRFSALSLIWDMLEESNWVSGINKADLEDFLTLFVTPIEIADTTGTQNALSVIVSTFNRDVSKSTPAEQNANFADITLQMMQLVNSWFVSMAHRAVQYEECRKGAEICQNRVTGATFAILSAEYQNGIVVNALPETCIAVCYPSARGGYAVRSVDDKIDGENVNRYKFPKIIRDTHSMIEGMEFCHPAGFYGKFDTLENAKRYLESTYLVAKRP